MIKNRTLKARIIPEEWKEDIDGIISRELLCANRYFAEANPRLAEMIAHQTVLTPEDFIQELKERWAWHNEFYENVLEPAIPLILEQSVFQLSPDQIDVLLEAYKACSLIDRATLVVSAAIKKHIAYWTDGHLLHSLSTDDRLLLLSLSKEPFPIQYQIDHISYFIAKNEGRIADAEKEKRKLTNQYHAGDVAIFNGRLKRFNYLSGLAVGDLQRMRDELKYGLAHVVRHFYLTLEHPRLRALRDILEYDNIEEYRIITTLVGISGFLLRKTVLRYLAETKLLLGTQGIYEFQDSIVEIGLLKLKKYRQEVLNKQVKPWRQHGPTCSAACFVAVANHFGVGKLNETFEFAVAQASRSYLIAGQHYSGIASQAVGMGLEVILLHSAQHFFDNMGNFFSDDLFKALVREYRSYLNLVENNQRLVVKCGAEITKKALRNYLEQGYLVMIAGVFGDDNLHSKLLIGYNATGFIVIDPLRGQAQQESYSNIEHFMDTKVGRWAMAIRPDQMPIRNLLIQTSLFQDKARRYLSRFKTP